MPEPKSPKQHILYRHFGHGGELLYIGISADPGRRLDAHARDSLWWSDVIGVTLEHFASRDELRQAEKDAIRGENPRCNKIHSANFRRPPRVRISKEATKLPAEHPLSGALDRVMIDGKRYVLPPSLYWDEARQAVGRR